MEQIARIGEPVEFSGCQTTGQVIGIHEGQVLRCGEQPMIIYEIRTVEGIMTLPGDWLAKLSER